MFKNIYKTPTTNIVLNREKLGASPSETTQECSILSLLFLEVQATTIRQGKEIKGIKIGGKKKVSLFTEDIIIYVKTPKNLSKKVLKLVSRA